MFQAIIPPEVAAAKVEEPEASQPRPPSPKEAPPPETKPTSDPSNVVEDLEKELELDLENMKLDENIDTSVSICRIFVSTTFVCI